MTLTFSEALDSLKQNNKIARTGWNGKNMFLMYYSPVAHGTVDFDINGETFILEPFIVIKTVRDTIVPWVPSIGDTLADDWVIVNDVHIA